MPPKKEIAVEQLVPDKTKELEDRIYALEQYVTDLYSIVSRAKPKIVKPV